MTEKSNLFSNTQLRSFLEKVINNYMVNIEVHKIAPIIKISSTVTQKDFCNMFESIIIPYFKLLVQQLKNDKSDCYSEYFKLYNYYINLYKLLKLILNNTSNKTLQIKYNEILLASTDVYFEYLWFDCVLNLLTKHFNIKFTKIVYKIYNEDLTLFNNIKEYVAHIEYMEQYNFIKSPDNVDVYYNERITNPYIKLIENYYESFTQREIVRCSIKEYIDKIIVIINIEINKAVNYFRPSIKKYISDACKRILISNYIENITEEVINMIDKYDLISIKALFDTLKSINYDDSDLHSGILNHIEKICRQEIELQKDNYTDTIISLYNKYINMYNTCFPTNNDANNRISNLISKIMINNSVITSEKHATEHLVRTLHECIRDDTESKHKIDNLINLFRHIPEKEDFIIKYRNLLAKRLLKYKQGDDNLLEIENYILEQMKNIQGISYIAKMKRMISDLSSSSVVNENFKKSHYIEYLDTSFDVKILTGNAWPLKKVDDFIIPTELTICMKLFNVYYSIAMPTRNLSWMLQHCNGVVKFKSNKANFTLKMSTYQIAIIMQFNNNLSNTIDKLVAATAIDKSYITAIMDVFIKAKIIVYKDENYILNVEYNNKKTIIDLNVPIKIDIDKESKVINDEIELNRKFIIQSTIIRIMKTRKSLSHQDLIQECIKQLLGKFTTSIHNIKSEIYLLIEKEYLKRSDIDINEYEYIA